MHKIDITDNELLTKSENQYFDRKSARIKPLDITRHLVAFANADGGILAIGIEDDGTLTGFGYKNAHEINDFVKAQYEIQGAVNIKYEERVIDIELPRSKLRGFHV